VVAGAVAGWCWGCVGVALCAGGHASQGGGLVACRRYWGTIAVRYVHLLILGDRVQTT